MVLGRRRRRRGKEGWGQGCVRFSWIHGLRKREQTSAHSLGSPPPRCPRAPEMRRDRQERRSGLFQNSCYARRVKGRAPAFPAQIRSRVSGAVALPYWTLKGGALLFSNTPLLFMGGLKPAAELASRAGEGKEEKPAKKGGERAGGGDGGGEGGWEGRRRPGGKERGQGPSGKGRSRSRAAPLAFSFRWRKTFRVWQIDCIPLRRLSWPLPEAKADFDCSPAAGPNPRLCAPDKSPPGAPQLAHQICARDRGSPGGGERLPFLPPPAPSATGPFSG